MAFVVINLSSNVSGTFGFFSWTLTSYQKTHLPEDTDSEETKAALPVWLSG